MRRAIIRISSLALAPRGPAGPASAPPPEPAGCVRNNPPPSALPPPSLPPPPSVSPLAPRGPRPGALVSPLAREHGGNCG